MKCKSNLKQFKGRLHFDNKLLKLHVAIKSSCRGEQPSVTFILYKSNMVICVGMFVG